MEKPGTGKCGVCGRVRDRDEMYIVQTNPEERAAIIKMGHEPRDEYIYCRPCWGVVSDPVRCAQLYKGMLQMRHSPISEVRAEKLGDRVYKFLIDHAKPKPS